MVTCGFYKALGPAALWLHAEATRVHKKVPLYYGKIIPPPLLSPPYSK